MKKIKVKDKEIRTLNLVPKLNEKQVDRITQKQVDFLTTIHPWLKDLDKHNDGALEVRPIRRDKELKYYARSYNAWHMDEKDKLELNKFNENLTGKGYCMYYSAYAFDYHLDCLKNDGKKFQKGKINNKNALFTCILPIDFDGMEYEEFAKEKAKLTALDIETIDIFSGHGFQSIILLEHRVYDKNIIGDFTNLLISRGFKADSNIVDCARVLRLPYTFNCKSLDPSQTEYYDPISPEIYPTVDIAWTERRYNAQDIFNKIATLEKIRTFEDETEKIKLIEEVKIKPIRSDTDRNEGQVLETVTTIKKQKKTRELQIKLENTKLQYPALKGKFDKLPLAIQKMLSETPQGLRNQTIMFLVPFFRNSLGLNIQTIMEIMITWGEHCKPSMPASAVEQDVNRIYKKGFKGFSGKYTKELSKQFGYVDFNEFKRDNKIIIQNAIFEDFDVISDAGVKIYLAMKLAQSLDNIQEFTKKDIEKYANISERTIERNTKDLVNMGYINKRRTNRRIGEKYIYYINPYISTTTGYTIIQNGIAEILMQKLNDSELKLFLYICRMIGQSDEPCWATQKYLAEKVGKKSHTTISKLTDSMDEKRVIDKIIVEDNDFIRHCKYTLKY